MRLFPAGQDHGCVVKVIPGHIGSRARISQQQCCMELIVVHFAAHGVASSQMVEKSLTWSRRDLYFSYADFLGVECRVELLLHLSEMVNQLSADRTYS